MHELLNKITGLSIVHSPDLLNTLVIGLFEPLETFLKLNKLISKVLIFLSEESVQSLGFSDLHFECLQFFTIIGRVFLESSSETLSLFSEDHLTLLEDLVVENKLLIVQSVDSLHIFHALLKDLHFSLKLDLLLSLLVGILTHHILQLLGVESFFFLAPLQKLGLNILVILKELFDFFLVACENGGSFSVKVSLDLLELLVIVFTHLNKLVFHA